MHGYLKNNLYSRYFIISHVGLLIPLLGLISFLMPCPPLQNCTMFFKVMHEYLSNLYSRYFIISHVGLLIPFLGLFSFLMPCPPLQNCTRAPEYSGAHA